MDEVRKAGKEVSICEQWGLRAPLGENSLVWYKKKKEGKNTLSKSERRTVLLLASFIPG